MTQIQAPTATSNRETGGSQIAKTRLVSLDQFRGFTVVSMLLVNYFGSYAACPQVLRHSHDYCSLADVIMPQFLFAVGFALRLTFGRRMATDGSLAAYARMTRRLLGLVLVSLVVYTVSPRAANWEGLQEIGIWGAIQEPLKRQWFQTLMHIAVTSLWILPVIHAKPSVRVGWMVGSALLHVILSTWFNFIWTNTAPNAIDGGPLGFLMWTTPALLGSFASDWFAGSGSSRLQATPSDSVRSVSKDPVRTALIWGGILMLAGYLFSCGTRMYDVVVERETNDASSTLAVDSQEFSEVESVATTSIATTDGKIAAYPVVPPWSQLEAKWRSSQIRDWLAEPPFVKPPGADARKWNYWMMSQRGGTMSYLVFAAGFSLVLFAAFYVVCDRWGFQWSFFTTFGTNALLAYVLHSMVANAVQPFFPKDSPVWYAYLGVALFYGINWIFIRSIEKQGIYLRV